MIGLGEKVFDFIVFIVKFKSEVGDNIMRYKLI